MFLKELESFIEIFTRLPGIGEKSARRIAFYLLRSDKEEAQKLAKSIINLIEKIQFCEICGGFSSEPICEICKDEKRNREILCIVEDPSDIFIIESTQEFNGIYHVLMGALSPLDGIGPENLRLKELEERLKKENIKECFIATNPTLEGDATADYIVRNYSHYPVIFSRLTHGIPTGSTLEFTDKHTLSISIKNRMIIK
ncbi:MAG: recombination protein RecR [Leptospiraceae bacterium]|nr:MAG: recombination protein RecR [Leptospiraceae bacterium]